MTSELFTLIITNIIPLVTSALFIVFIVGGTLLVYKSTRNLDLSQLFIDHKTGNISHTKFWSNIAYFVATIAFLALNFIPPGVGSSIEFIWIIYLGVVATNAVASKAISYKWGGAGNDDKKNV